MTATLGGSKFIEAVAEMLDYNMKTWDRIQDKIEQHVCGEEEGGDDVKKKKKMKSGKSVAPVLKTAGRVREVPQPPPPPQPQLPRNPKPRRAKKNHERTCIDNGKIMCSTTYDFSSMLPGERRLAEEKILAAVDSLTSLPEHDSVQQYLYTEKRTGLGFVVHKESLTGWTQLCRNKAERVSMKTMKKITYTVLKILVFLKYHRIAHGHIRLRSIYLRKAVDGVVHVQLTAPLLTYATSPQLQTSDRPWCPPEDHPLNPTIQGDIWSLGCVLMELFTAKRPWEHLGSREAAAAVVAKIGPVQLPRGVEGVLADFLAKCLVMDCKGRAEPEELLRHPYLAEIVEWGAEETGVVGSSPPPQLAMRTAPPRPLDRDLVIGGPSSAVRGKEVSLSPPPPQGFNVGTDVAVGGESPIYVRSEFTASPSVKCFGTGTSSPLLKKQNSVRSLQEVESPVAVTVAASSLETRLTKFEDTLQQITDRQDATASALATLLQQGQQRQLVRPEPVAAEELLPYHYYPEPPPHPQEVWGATPICISR